MGQRRYIRKTIQTDIAQLTIKAFRVAKELAAVLLFAFFFAVPSNAQFVVLNSNDTIVGAKGEEASEKLAKKVIRQWRNTNSRLPKQLRDQVISGYQTFSIPRLSVMPIEEKQLALVVSKEYVGFVELFYNDISLGYALINEAGGCQVEAYLTPLAGNDSIAESEENATRKLVHRSIDFHRHFMVSGIGIGTKVLMPAGNTFRTVDLFTGDTTPFSKSDIPDYAYLNEPERSTGAVAVSIICGAATLGILFGVFAL